MTTVDGRTARIGSDARELSAQHDRAAARPKRTHLRMGACIRMRTGGIVIVVLGLVAGASLFAGPLPVRAAAITVTTTADEVEVNGQCSLREAVIAANTNAPVDSCPAGSATDIDNIYLADARYELTIEGAGEDAGLTGDLDILGDTIFDGSFLTLPTPTTIVDGGGLDRVFDVHPTAERIGFRYMTVSGGSVPGEDGGGIRQSNAGTPNGDTCAASARVGIAFATVRDNAAANGGGISIGACGVLDAEWTTIADNQATGNGGAVAVGALGGVRLFTGTLSGNRANGDGGGLWAEGAIVDGLYWSTVADNSATSGGGVFFVGNPAMSFGVNSTIFAHNGGGNCGFEAGVDAFVTHSLSSDETCVTEGSGNLASTDPMLATRDATLLAYPLLPGSPAIDAGPDVTNWLDGDQFGNTRPVDGDGDGLAVIDIGSYEAPEVPSAASPSPMATPTPSGGGSLPDTAADQPLTTAPGLLAVILALAGSLTLRLRRR